jgi:hypothetical protein
VEGETDKQILYSSWNILLFSRNFDDCIDFKEAAVAHLVEALR